MPLQDIRFYKGRGLTLLAFQQWKGKMHFANAAGWGRIKRRFADSDIAEHIVPLVSHEELHDSVGLISRRASDMLDNIVEMDRPMEVIFRGVGPFDRAKLQRVARRFLKEDVAVMVATSIRGIPLEAGDGSVVGTLLNREADSVFVRRCGVGVSEETLFPDWRWIVEPRRVF